jgi:hypothetical protein
VLTAEGLALAVVAVALAVPVPLGLARARWPARSPRAALVLWQAVGLGGGLAILGCGLTLAVSGLHRSWLRGLAALPGALPPGGRDDPGPLGWIGVALTVLAAAWLGVVLVYSTWRLVRNRSQHRRRVDLLTDEVPVDDLLPAATPASGPAGADGQGGPPLAGQPGPGLRRGLSDGLRVRLLDHPLVAAYCLPGVRPRIVLSQGVIDLLSADELAAVLAHERAHARGQHDLVILPFRAWRQTFAFLTAPRAALAAVELLVEMLADDAAGRRCGRAPLLAALGRLADATPGDTQIATRADRLAAPPLPLRGRAVALIYLAAAALICLPPVLLLAS